MANRYRTVNEVEYDGRPRMEPQKQRDIESRRTQYHKMSPFKDTDENVLDKLATQGFKLSVEKVRNALGSTEKIEGTNLEVLRNLSNYVGEMIYTIKEKEAGITNSLENLAVKIVKRMFNLSDDKFLFDAKLTGGPLPPAAGMRLQNKEPSVEEIQKAFSKSKEPEADMDDFIQAMETFDLETAKRTFINTLVQGFSLQDASYYKYGSIETGVDPETNEKIFTNISEILNNYDSELVELYSVSQAILEHLYWIYPEEYTKNLIKQGAGQVGQVEIDDETDPVTIKARGLTFPILLHELIKGVMKVPATFALPDDPTQANLVMQSTDTVPNEAWALMFGPIMTNRITKLLPTRMFEDESTRGEILFNLIHTIANSNYKRFFKLLKLVWDENEDEIIRTGNLKKAEEALNFYVTEIENKMKERYLKDKFGEEDDEDFDDTDDDETMV